MTKQSHTCQAAKTAAYDTDGDQSCFRNTPMIFFGFLLVRKHKQKAGRID